LKRTVAGFSNPPFECETTCDKSEHAYLHVITRSLSDTHICWYFFEKVDQSRHPVDILHEVAHKYTDKDDMNVRVVDQEGERTLLAHEFNQSAYDALTADEAVHTPIVTPSSPEMSIDNSPEPLYDARGRARTLSHTPQP
jgi:hypothetical protein